MNRFKAAGIHLLLSIFIVATVLAVMYFLWYPKGYFTIMGGKTLISLIGFVDVFLGPLLTFIVFKSGKKNLKLDLFCIGLVQICALTYGVYVMFESRPVFTVFNKNQFRIAAVVDITPEELAKAKHPQWKKYSMTGPVLVAIGKPNENDKKERMFALTAGPISSSFPSLYDQYDKHLNEVIQSGKSLASLSSASPENKAAVDEFMRKTKRPESDFLYLPITSELLEMSAIVDAKTGDFIEIINAVENKP